MSTLIFIYFFSPDISHFCRLYLPNSFATLKNNMKAPLGVNQRIVSVLDEAVDFSLTVAVSDQAQRRPVENINQAYQWIWRVTQVMMKTIW
jgi:hypothetical protein